MWQLELPLADNTVASLAASAVLPRYSHRLVSRVLADWWRVLRTGGRLHLFAMPDMRFIAEEYLAGVQHSQSLRVF